MKNAKNKQILGVGIFVVLIAILALVFFNFREKPVAGSKEISIEVIDKEGESTTYELKTDAEYLQQAMDEADGLTYGGAETQYGFTVDTINGERADYTLDKAYWGFFVNDEYCNYGISSQPVNDGDAFQIVYTPAE